jgi:hypothetical protein
LSAAPTRSDEDVVEKTNGQLAVASLPEDADPAQTGPRRVIVVSIRPRGRQVITASAMD